MLLSSNINAHLAGRLGFPQTLCITLDTFRYPVTKCFQLFFANWITVCCSYFYCNISTHNSFNLWNQRQYVIEELTDILTLRRSKSSSPGCLFSMNNFRFLKTWKDIPGLRIAHTINNEHLQLQHQRLFTSRSWALSKSKMFKIVLIQSVFTPPELECYAILCPTWVKVPLPAKYFHLFRSFWNNADHDMQNRVLTSLVFYFKLQYIHTRRTVRGKPANNYFSAFRWHEQGDDKLISTANTRLIPRRIFSLHAQWCEYASKIPSADEVWDSYRLTGEKQVRWKYRSGECRAAQVEDTGWRSGRKFFDLVVGSSCCHERFFLWICLLFRELFDTDLNDWTEVCDREVSFQVCGMNRYFLHDSLTHSDPGAQVQTLAGL